MIDKRLSFRGFSFTLTPTRIVLILLTLIGLAATAYRFAKGLGASTNLSDTVPWGLWISFDVLSGVALAAGAFVTAGTVYIFGLERFRPLVKPAILTGFLGYVLVVIALFIDLGQSLRIWHALIYWNFHSVLFEVAWCVMTYTTVLAFEFSPMLFERLRQERILNILHKVTIPLVILGICLSTMHQSSLGSLFVIMPGRAHPLWYSMLLPVYFFLTAVAVGFAMVIVESTISTRAFRRKPETELLADFAKPIPVILVLYLVIKYLDLLGSGKLALLTSEGTYSALFVIEILIGVVAPALLLSSAKIRNNRSGLFWSALLVVLGVVLNRFNLSLLTMEETALAGYFPSWMEFAITIGIISGGVLAYIVCAENLNVFGPESESGHQPAITGSTRAIKTQLAR